MAIFIHSNGTTADSLWGSQAGHAGHRHGIQKNHGDLPKRAKSSTLDKSYTGGSYQQKLDGFAGIRAGDGLIGECSCARSLLALAFNL